MNKTKIYREIFSNIIKGNEQQRKFELDNDHVLISPNGYYGFVVGKGGLPFNLELIKSIGGSMELTNVVKEENLLTRTNHFVMVKPHGLVSVFCNCDRNVYINSKYLGFFEDYAELYQEKDLSICVVVEHGEIVGAVCPIRYREIGKMGGDEE
jgi:hypothetical protein